MVTLSYLISDETLEPRAFNIPASSTAIYPAPMTATFLMVKSLYIKKYHRMGMILGEKSPQLQQWKIGESASHRQERTLGTRLCQSQFSLQLTVWCLVYDAFHHGLLWVKGWVPGYQRKTLSLKLMENHLDNLIIKDHHITDTNVLWKIL